MINLMNENGLVELEIEKDGMRIRLKKTTLEAQLPGAPMMIERERISDSGSMKLALDSGEKSGVKTIEIKAPMVGTFYRAPSPEAPPYIEVGQTIETGQVICVIEAMKLMNEIKTEIRGRIVEILVDNAEPVEFGQTIFLLEPL